jgi:hypothetical protein
MRTIDIATIKRPLSTSESRMQRSSVHSADTKASENKKPADYGGQRIDIERLHAPQPGRRVLDDIVVAAQDTADHMQVGPLLEPGALTSRAVPAPDGLTILQREISHSSKPRERNALNQPLSLRS